MNREELKKIISLYVDSNVDECVNLAIEYAEFQTKELQSEIVTLKNQIKSAEENEELLMNRKNSHIKVLKDKIERLKAENDNKVILENEFIKKSFISQFSGTLTMLTITDPITNEPKQYTCNVDVKCGNIYYPIFVDDKLTICEIENKNSVPFGIKDNPFVIDTLSIFEPIK